VGAETYPRKPGISAPLYANGMHTLGRFWAVETKNGSRKGIALYHTVGFQLREARKELKERQYRAVPHPFSCLDLCLEVKEISSGVECATSPGGGSG
jgi:hypothetical protein